jgi:accessory gene regulator protein AgrB
MIEFFGIKLSVEAAAFLVLFLVDELIPFLPVKGNNFVQVAQGIIGQLKLFRKEDDAIRALKVKIEELKEELGRL